MGSFWIRLSQPSSLGNATMARCPWLPFILKRLNTDWMQIITVLTGSVREESTAIVEP